MKLKVSNHKKALKIQIKIFENNDFQFNFLVEISDIQLEIENDDSDENLPNYNSDSIYHPRVALKSAIRDWLPDFFDDKKAYGPMLKPQPPSAVVLPIIPPIIPIINTCIGLTLTTNSITIPDVNTTQLQALADICCSVTNDAIYKPSVMNSLVSETKVVTTDAITSPIVTTSVYESNIKAETMEIEKTVSTEELMDCGTPKHTLSDNSSLNSDPPIAKDSLNGSNDQEKVEKLSDDVVMIETRDNETEMQDESISDEDKIDAINCDDILLLCDLFHLPFAHGKQGLAIMNEFQWLKINAYILSGNKAGAKAEQTDIQEWFDRKEKFMKLCESVFMLTKKVATCVNQELCYDLYTYCWEISTVVSICSSYVQWLALGEFPTNANSYIQGSYTWFSKGWKETFMSGDQEPWIFRGGLVVDIQRLVPIDSGNDLFIYKLPETPVLSLFTIRPFVNQDEKNVFQVCHQTCRDGFDCTELFPDSLQEIASDRLVAPFIILNPEFCMVVENAKKTIIGYACAAPDAKHFYRGQEVGH